jgi:DNA-binding transcriptional LysR family regulator
MRERRTFYRTKSDVPELRRLALESLPTLRFQAGNCQGGGGSPRALAFVAAGYGLAIVSEPLQKIPAKEVIFRDLPPEDRAWMPVGAVWKPDSLTAPAASKFIDVLAQVCGDGNGKVGSVA